MSSSGSKEILELAARIGEQLKQRQWILAIAESCTGGLLGHYLTEIPGSSEYFTGGVVAYSYEAKERLLGVRHATLNIHGAVSYETACEMARGVRAAFGAQLAVSITGIAGPGGGTPDKPVGLVYIALVAGGYERCEHYVWNGDRSANKQASARAALHLIEEYLARPAA